MFSSRRCDRYRNHSRSPSQFLQFFQHLPNLVFHILHFTPICGLLKLTLILVRSRHQKHRRYGNRRWRWLRLSRPSWSLLVNHFIINFHDSFSTNCRNRPPDFHCNCSRPALHCGNSNRVKKFIYSATTSTSRNNTLKCVTIWNWWYGNVSTMSYHDANWGSMTCIITILDYVSNPRLNASNVS